jgi:hypothetical protein
VHDRLARHNTGDVASTSPHRPWHLHAWFADPDTARRFERYLKSDSGRAFAKLHF